MRFCHQNEVPNRQPKIGISAGVCQTLLREHCALLFVVGGVCVVNGIMKPNGKLYRDGIRSKVSCGIEFGQAFHNVLRLVIVPVWLRVSRRQDIEPRRTITMA